MPFTLSEINLKDIVLAESNIGTAESNEQKMIAGNINTCKSQMQEISNLKTNDSPMLLELNV